MPKKIKRKTKYPGVYYTLKAGQDGRPERVFCICYRKEGKIVEELAGGQFQDNITAEGAAHLRMERLNGLSSPKDASREGFRQSGKIWTFNRLWETYKIHRPGLKGLRTDENRYQNHLKPSFGHREPKSLTPLEVPAAPRASRNPPAGNRQQCSGAPAPSDEFRRQEASL
jgi:hypothetical protein